MSRKTALAAAATVAMLLLLSLSTPAAGLRKVAVAAQEEHPRLLLSVFGRAGAAAANVGALSRKKKPDPEPAPPSEPPSPPPPPRPPSPSKGKNGGASAFSLLAAAYSLLGAVAAVQLYRIHARVPEFGWTTQKVFHALNAAVCFLRALGFAFHPYLETEAPAAVAEAVFDAPGLLFFTTYTLLVLFWAEIYHQARVRVFFFFAAYFAEKKEQERRKERKIKLTFFPLSLDLLFLSPNNNK